MKRSGMTNTLRRLVRRLNADAHGDEAEALKLVDMLMREYGFTRHPLTRDAEQFSDDLRRLVADWMCTPNVAPDRRWKDAVCGGLSAYVSRCWFGHSFLRALDARDRSKIHPTIAY